MPNLRMWMTAAVVTVLCLSPCVDTAWAREPADHTHTVQPLELIQEVSMPLLDLDAIAVEDDQREEDGLAPRFAISESVLITPDADGTWERLGDELMLWRLHITAEDAVSLNLGFTRYTMPPSGSLLIYSSGKQHMIRPFTEADNEIHGELWTPVILSNDIVVELLVSQAEVDSVELELTHIGQGYRGFGADSAYGGDKSGSCNVDVVCPEGDDWRDQISTVGVISTGGSTFCTGFMVNNTAGDKTPYFMTAYHCGIRSYNAASLVVYWNYENSWCRAPGSGSSGGSGDGSLSEFQTGSFLRAARSASDFTLVELDDDPDPDWEVGFAGWDRSGANATSAVAIHHPNTDEKRISFEYQPTSVTSYLSNPVPGDGTHVRITDWDLGTTEPGSSGSPLFDQNKRIIGQLHGGYASCSSQTSDWYGAFAVSWDAGSSASARLRDWLDPGNTGATTTNFLAGNIDDCNDNGIPDTLDLQWGTSADCNHNAIPDECDIASGLLQDVNGNIVPDLCEFQPPAVVAEGPRYVTVRAQPDDLMVPMAIKVTGDPGNPEVSCMSYYVQPDGSLGATPTFKTPDTWGEVHVSSLMIRPETMYNFQAEIEEGATTSLTSGTTWMWGDVNDDLIVNVDDLLLLISGFQGDFSKATRENLDLDPCEPNTLVNIGDIFAAIAAFQGEHFADKSCQSPCQ